MLNQSKLRNESGMVLMIVIMIVLVIMIISITILSQSMNQTSTAREQIDQIKADQIAKGIFWNAYSSEAITPSAGQSMTVDGKVYTVDVSSPADQPAIGGSQPYSVNISY